VNYNYTHHSAASAGGGAIGMVVILIYLAVIVLMIASMWRLFTKAGKPGWAAIVPIYNIVVLLEIIGKPLWWIVMFLIPCVSLVFAVMMTIEVAKCFGKDVGFGIGLLLLAPIFYPILAFGDSQYVGPMGGSPATL